MMLPKGQVFLVGAGPGDPELLTQKALMLLEIADVVLYDYLIPTNGLLRCKPDTILECVGKKKGNHSATQTYINHRMVEYAQQGKCVVRLKGGDPLTFGRGGEEMEFLKAKGIPYQVIPGVSSAMAVPAVCGIPLTHREYSRSVAFVTGTLHNGSYNGEFPVADTLVCLMALTGLEAIVEKLKSHGSFTHETPAALVQSGTRAEQKIIVGTLGTISELKKKENLKSPAMLIVGNVVQIASQLEWRSQLPLSGKRIVLLRPYEQSQALMQTLEFLGAEVVLAPMIQLVQNIEESKKMSAEYLSKMSHVIFTSVNGVRYFFQALKAQKIDIRKLAQIHIVTIGPRTQMELELNGLYADSIPDQFDSNAIAQYFSDHTKTAGNILIPTTSKADSDLENNLKNLGHTVTRLNLYHTEKPKQVLAELQDGDYVFFTSASTVEFAHELRFWTSQHIHPYSIGPKTTQEIIKRYPNVEVNTAQTSTTDAMLSLLLQSMGPLQNTTNCV